MIKNAVRIVGSRDAADWSASWTRDLERFEFHTLLWLCFWILRFSSSAMLVTSQLVYLLLVGIILYHLSKNACKLA